MVPSLLNLSLGLLAASQHVFAATTFQCPGPAPPSKPVTAPGVQYKVLLNGLSKPRGIIVDPKGNLLLVEAKDKGLKRVVLNDATGMDVCVDSSDTIIPDTTLNHGIALSHDGKTLFASSMSNVYAYTYDAETGTVGPAKDLISGMAQTDHVTRTLLIPKHNSDLLLVSRGSNDNVDKETADIESGRSQLRIFKIADLLASTEPVDYTAGEVLGWGLRNSVGVAEDPTNGHIWTVENSLDQMKRNGDDIHQSNPGEELNFHGLPNDTSSSVYGHNYGYPYCVSITDPSTVKGYPEGAKVGMQMTGDHIEGMSDEQCRDEKVAPRITFGAHLAPLDIKFLADGSAALIPFHGSWNRQPPNGYRLSRVSFANSQPVQPSTSTDAEEHLMWNEDNTKCPSGCFRPVSVALDGKGRVFMTSDASGELFVLSGVDGAEDGGY